MKIYVNIIKSLLQYLLYSGTEKVPDRERQIERLQESDRETDRESVGERQIERL